MSKNVIICGRASKYLATQVADILGKSKAEFIDVEVTVFADKEFVPQITKSIRGKDVYVIQSTFQPYENLMEAIFLGDASMRASARSITLLSPYLCGGRQERKDKPRVPISAKAIARMIECEGHYNRIITMDLHADQIEGYFDIPVDNLYSSAILVPYLKNLNLSNLIIASPDSGGTKRANKYANLLGVEMVMCYKDRSKANEIKSMKLIGDVFGKDVVLVDDIWDTGNTLVTAANIMMEKGAKSVRAAVAHPVASGNAYNLIENSILLEIIVCNTIPLKEGERKRKITVLSTAELFADVIWRISTNESISSLFL